MKRNQIMFFVVVGLLMSLFSSLSAVVVIDTLYNVTGNQVINDDVLIEPEGTIQNSGGTCTLTINGDVTNHGIVRNNLISYNLNVEVSGDLYNNGEWSCRTTTLTGTGGQDISCGGTEYFSTTYLYNNNATDIIVSSNLYFLNTNIHFQYNGALDLSGGWDIYMDGGSIHQATIIGSGNELNITNGINMSSSSAGNVTINGLVNICDGGVTFSDFLINNGTIQNSGGSFTLTIAGDITNNGTIRNNPGSYNLYLDITGDIINNGDWTNNDIELTGTSDQHISCPSDSLFSVSYFYGNGSRANIYFDSDIEFIGTTINLNNDNVILQSGMTLTLSGGYMFDGTLTGTTAAMDISGNNYFYLLTMNIDDLTLSGTFQTINNVTINGDVINDGYLQNYYNGSHPLYLNGGITNNGTIRNHPSSYNFHLDISGDIINNGIWTNKDIELTGAGQHISCGAGNFFDIDNFYGNSSARGDVYFDSDIGFTGTTADLNGDNIILQSGITLSLSGGYLFDGTLTGTTAALDISSNNYFYLLTLNIDDLTLSGTCQIANNVTMNGDVSNNGYLQNYPGGNFNLYLNGSMTNDGTVRNHPSSYNLFLDISGDINNNGVWTNKDIELTGANQHISCGAGNIFDIDNFYGNSSVRGDVYFDSDIGFTGTVADLNADNIILQSGITLSLAGGYMFDGTLTGTTATMNISGSNYIYLLTINVDDLTLTGTCEIANDVIMNGNLINNGYLQNLYGNFLLIVNGDLTNNGTVRNNPSGYNFYTYLKQDVTNNGSWTNFRNNINGTIDQTITINNPNEITADVRFDSDVTGAPYQWYFDGAVLNDADFIGETSAQLNWQVPVASGWFGTFYCLANGVESRDIIIVESGAAPDTPQNLTITIVDPNVVLDWDDVLGATSYTVYSDSDPYGSFTTDEWTGAISECSLPIPGDKEFYRVTASN